MRFFILQTLSQQLAVVEALIDTKSAFFKKKNYLSNTFAEEMFFGHNMYINEKQFLCYLRNWSIVAFEKQLIIYLILNQSIVFVSLCCEINQVISKCQMGFLDKTYKKKQVQNRKVTITIEFFIFEVV